MYVKPDDLARYTDLSTGAVQIAVIQAADWNLVKASPDQYTYLSVPPQADLMSALAFNAARYPTNITAVRQAIVHAINYTEVVQKGFLGYLSPFVGPEYSAWKQFYNLGNYSQYSYNLTLAKDYLSKANIANLPTLQFTVPAGCTYCVTIGEVVQADLSQIGINVNIEVIDINTYNSPYGGYSFTLSNAQQVGHISIAWTLGNAPADITPVDNWIAYVSNSSVYGNWAIYNNPTVDKLNAAFLSTSNSTYLQSLVAKAQAQVYNDAPYYWLGINQLQDFGGAAVWQKQVITGAYKGYMFSDPCWNGENDMVLFNTVVFTG
jgi:ABC-type transport system substrate-binding protein